MLFRTPNSIGRVAADREAGADYAGHAESCGCSNKLVTVRPEAWAITWMKSVNEIIEPAARVASLEKSFFVIKYLEK